MRVYRGGSLPLSTKHQGVGAEFCCARGVQRCTSQKRRSGSGVRSLCSIRSQTCTAAFLQVIRIGDLLSQTLPNSVLGDCLGSCVDSHESSCIQLMPQVGTDTGRWSSCELNSYLELLLQLLSDQFSQKCLQLFVSEQLDTL